MILIRRRARMALRSLCKKKKEKQLHDVIMLVQRGTSVT